MNSLARSRARKSILHNQAQLGYVSVACRKMLS
jgi:hypothetical protein